MSCGDCPDGRKFDLIKEFPEKTKQLNDFIDALDIGPDRNRNRGFLIESLHEAQHIFGYLPRSVQQFVADKLHLYLSEVYGVISFYSYFTDRPVGKYKISVCTGTACFVRGANAVLEEFKRLLVLENGETTPDRKFSLASLRCVGACSLAPVVMVNDQVYGKVTAKMVADIINECK
ncbi:MAG: NAD(P)H-dependent oxidoreductase subunit E [Victivallaceae bacterium]|nr:NAD(P)H-dependent oxidoreductase subunit E [Victivallaceae bacterium]